MVVASRGPGRSIRCTSSQRSNFAGEKPLSTRYPKEFLRSKSVSRWGESHLQHLQHWAVATPSHMPLCPCSNTRWRSCIGKDARLRGIASVPPKNGLHSAPAVWTPCLMVKTRPLPWSNRAYHHSFILGFMGLPINRTNPQFLRPVAIGACNLLRAYCSEVYITQLRRNAMGVGLVFEANLHTKELSQNGREPQTIFDHSLIQGYYPKQPIAEKGWPDAADLWRETSADQLASPLQEHPSIWVLQGVAMMLNDDSWVILGTEPSKLRLYRPPRLTSWGPVLFTRNSWSFSQLSILRIVGKKPSGTAIAGSEGWTPGGWKSALENRELPMVVITTA